MKVTEVESLNELGIGLIVVGVFILILAILLVIIPHMKKGKRKAAGAVIMVCLESVWEGLVSLFLFLVLLCRSKR